MQKVGENVLLFILFLGRWEEACVHAWVVDACYLVSGTVPHVNGACFSVSGTVPLLNNFRDCATRLYCAYFI